MIIWPLLLLATFYSIIGFLVYMVFRTAIGDNLGLSREQDHAYSLLASMIWPVSVPLAVVASVCWGAYQLCKHLVESYQVISTHLKETMSGDQ